MTRVVSESRRTVTSADATLVGEVMQIQYLRRLEPSRRNGTRFALVVGTMDRMVSAAWRVFWVGLGAALVLAAQALLAPAELAPPPTSPEPTDVLAPHVTHRAPAARPFVTPAPRAPKAPTV